MSGRLNQIQALYSSPDPDERLRGAIGKAFVEGGFIIGFSVVILLPLLLIQIFVIEIDPLSLPLANISVPVVVVGYFSQQFLCNIIIDLRTVEDQAKP